MSETAANSPGPPAAPAAHPSGIADPAPLGLAGFAMTTMALSLWNANIYPAAVSAALALALAYGGGAQLLAGMWEFKRGNTFAATAFSSYGAFWIAFWYLVVHILPGVKAVDVPVVVGTFLVGWTLFTFYMTIAALRVSGAVLVVFILLTIAFVLLTIGNYRTNATFVHWGGYVGLATAAAAWYASFAGVANSTFGKAVIPVWPLAK
jgi:succinate-acetate transporter protein